MPSDVWLFAITLLSIRILFLQRDLLLCIMAGMAKIILEKETKLIKTTVRIPEHLVTDLTDAGKKHYRSFNNELIVAIEQYLANWKNKH